MKIIFTDGEVIIQSNELGTMQDNSLLCLLFAKMLVDKAIQPPQEIINHIGRTLTFAIPEEKEVRALKDKIFSPENCRKE